MFLDNAFIARIFWWLSKPTNWHPGRCSKKWFVSCLLAVGSTIERHDSKIEILYENSSARSSTDWTSVFSRREKSKHKEANPTAQFAITFAHMVILYVPALNPHENMANLDWSIFETFSQTCYVNEARHFINISRGIDGNFSSRVVSLFRHEVENESAMMIYQIHRLTFFVLLETLSAISNDGDENDKYIHQTGNGVGRWDSKFCARAKSTGANGGLC